MKRLKAFRRAKVVNELVLVVRRSPAAGRQRFRVGIQNADPVDSPMAKALARIYELWVNSGRFYE